MDRGRPFDYVDEGRVIDEELLCSVCSEPLCEPVMHQSCGNLACAACVPSSGACPICGASTKGTLSDAPRVIKNRVNALLVYCPLCHVEKVPRVNLESHLVRCAGRSPASLSMLAAATTESRSSAYGLFSQSPAFVLGGEEMNRPPISRPKAQLQFHYPATADRQTSAHVAPGSGGGAVREPYNNLEGELLARLGLDGIDDDPLPSGGDEQGGAAVGSGSNRGSGDGGADTVVMNARMLKQMEKRMLSTAMNALAMILNEKQGTGGPNSARADTLDPALVNNFVHALPLCSAKRLAEPRSLWDELWAAVDSWEPTAGSPPRQMRVLATYFGLPEHLQTVRNWWRSHAASQAPTTDGATLATITELREAFLAAVSKHRLPTRDLYKRLMNYRYHVQDNFAEFHGNWTRQLREIETRLGFPPHGFARLAHLLFARGLTEDSRVVECLMPILPDLEFIDPWDERTVQAIAAALSAAKHVRTGAAVAAGAKGAVKEPAVATTGEEVAPVAGSGKDRRFCFKCKQSGHVVKQCPENPVQAATGQVSAAAGVAVPVPPAVVPAAAPASAAVATVATSAAPVDKEEKKERESYEKCYRCGERGHKRKDCPHRAAHAASTVGVDASAAKQPEDARARDVERDASERQAKDEKERSAAAAAAKAKSEGSKEAPAVNGAAPDAAEKRAVRSIAVALVDLP